MTVTSLLLLRLEWMTEKKFVRLESGGIVHLAPEGVQAYNELVSWIIEHVGQLRLSRSRLASTT